VADVSSLRDVAALASVSTATVSRVLSGSSHPVAASTRQRVLKAVKELDFEPNMLASGLARSRTQVAAVVVHDVMDEYFSEIARGIEDEAYAKGYVTVICNTDRDPDKEVHYLRKLRALRVDAILFAAGGVRNPRHRAEVDRQLGKVEAAGGVIVRLAPYPGGRPDVGYSNRLGLSLAVDHLVELGHGAIAFLAGPPGIATSTDRLSAMRQAMKRHGLALADALIFDGGFSRKGGERAAAEFVAAGLPATAIVAANDQAAIGFMRGLRERDVDVPGAVSVVGYDDIGPSSFVEPPLTTVHVPLHELGVLGMRWALQLLGGASRSTPIELPLELTVRASTAPPAALQAGQQDVQTTDVHGNRLP
jgi:LacI family transcriptional regulator